MFFCGVERIGRKGSKTEMNINPFGPYFVGALKTAITSCFINGRINEQQIDFAKEVISKFREAEI